ncbi:MAG TPA: HAD-IA family hydrolase, partial [Tepidiformaceae bacterium]|nr:HAD-IA family hydrolase [Tepidiformaceae bacterium]
DDLFGALDAARAMGLRVGVVSNSEGKLPELFAAVGLGDAFEVIVDSAIEGVRKPDPEIYLLAARRLGAAARDCLAFEDAPAGIQSARAAGMTVWAVRTEYTRGLELPGPHREFDSLTDVELDAIVGVAA